MSKKFPLNDELSIKTAAKLTMQEEQKEHVRFLLERIWKKYGARLRDNGHELVVLAVPTYPANIEAVSAMDLSDINDLMAVFAKHREDHPNELHPIEQASGESPEPPEQSVEESYVLGRDASTGAFALGTRHDGGGAPQERAEPAAEPHEGYSSLDAMGSGSMLDPIGTPLRKKGFEVDTAAVARMTDEEVDGFFFTAGPTVDTSDIPEAGEDWFKKAKMVKPEGKDDDEH